MKWPVILGISSLAHSCVISQRVNAKGVYFEVFYSIHYAHFLRCERWKTCDVHAKHFNERKCQCLFVCTSIFGASMLLLILVCVALRIFARCSVPHFVRVTESNSICDMFAYNRLFGKNEICVRHFGLPLKC